MFKTGEQINPRSVSNVDLKIIYVSYDCDISISKWQLSLKVHVSHVALSYFASVLSMGFRK